MRKKLLIIDDELRLCTLITRLIHWDSLGIDLMGYAHDGVTGLERILGEKPDIVITDIRMPNCSGLDIVEKCHALKLPVKFIIITGYSEFEYAYKAIKFGIENFLLKPIDALELNATLSRIVESLDGDGAAGPVGGDVIIADGVTPDSGSILTLFMNPAQSTPAQLSAFAPLYDGQPLNWALLPCILRIDKDHTRGSYIDSLFKHLTHILHSHFAHLSVSLYLATEPSALLLLVGVAPDRLDDTRYVLQNTLDDMLEYVLPYQFIRLTIGVGVPAANVLMLPDAVLSARHAALSRQILGQNRVIDAGKIGFSRNRYVPDKVDMTALNAPLREFDVGAFTSALRTCFFSHLPAAPKDAHRMPETCYAFVRALDDLFDSAVSPNQPNEPGDKAERMMDLRAKVEALPTAEAVFDTLAEEYTARLERLKAQYENATSRIIRTVKEYIQAHYPEPLELNDIGKVVYLNPVYLGTLFKKETGENFSAYLTMIRIEKARELLLDIRFNVGEIARMVGYKDTHHFGKTFRRYVGLSPNEYRKYHSKL